MFWGTDLAVADLGGAGVNAFQGAILQVGVGGISEPAVISSPGSLSEMQSIRPAHPPAAADTWEALGGAPRGALKSPPEAYVGGSSWEPQPYILSLVCSSRLLCRSPFYFSSC